MKIKADIKIPQDILIIQRLFTDNNKKIFVVGGAVRDFLLNKEPNDFDLVTDASPDEVINILQGYRTDLQGVHFGVVRVFTADEPEGHEIASFRTDISKGRNTKGDDKKVEIGNHITIEDDIQRRDLTINALFFDIESKEIIDLVGGINDLENKIIRTVGRAADRFEEDRLRILRMARQSILFNFDIDNEITTALENDNRLFNISDIDDVSKERIIEEFNKVEQKSFNNPSNLKRYFELLDSIGVLKQIFPISFNIKLIETTSLTLLLAQLFAYNMNMVELTNVLKTAKLPNKIINQIIGLLDFRNGVTPNNVVKLKKTQQSKHIHDLILEEWFSCWNLPKSLLHNFLNFTLSVSGEEVMKDGFKGKDIADEIARRECINFEKFIKPL